MEYKLSGLGRDAITFKADEPTRVTAVASTFGNRDRGGDIVVRGAFDGFVADVKAGREPLPRITDAHVDVVGVYDSLKVTSAGLIVEGAPNQDLQAGRDLMVKVSSTPAIYESASIGYRIKKDGAHWDEAKGVRMLTDLEVPEVALLAFPMNPKARIRSVKDELIDVTTIRELEGCLREAGFSRLEAKVIAAYGYPGLQRAREAGERTGLDDHNEDNLSASVKLLSDCVAALGVSP